MQILVAVDDLFHDYPGGMARVAWEIAQLMRSRGHTVTLISRDRSGHLAETDEYEGIRIVRYRVPTLSRWDPRRAHAAITDARDAARRRLADTRWDVVHMHSPLTGAGVLDGLGPGPRYVYTMHSPMVLEQRINWAAQGWSGRFKLLFGQRALLRLERRILEASAAVHTLSRFTREQIRRFHGLEHKVTVVPHWRDDRARRTMSRAEARARLGWPADRPVLYTLRRHGPRYGLDIALRAAAPLLQKYDARLVMAGDGPLRPTLQQLARDLGVADRVDFPGRISDEVMALSYQAADLFLLPTLALECFGLITLEAFSYGCPVLSTDAAAIPETMRPILPDFIVPAGDERAMHEKLDAFLSGRLVPPTPEALFEHVEAHYGRAVIEPRLAAVLEGTPVPATVS